jgi:hypothetical protein
MEVCSNGLFEGELPGFTELGPAGIHRERQTSAARFVGAAFSTGKTREHTVDPPELLVGRMFISLEKRRSHPRTKDS